MPAKLKYIILFAAGLVFLLGCQGELKKVTIRVHNNDLSDTSAIYITGNNKVLGNWNPSFVKLNRDSSNTWSKTFFFHQGEKIEYDFTHGSFSSEAYGPKGILYIYHLFLTEDGDTTVTTDIKNWRSKTDGSLTLRKGDLDTNDRVFILYGWKYHSGDNARWADPAYNDSNWEVTSTYLSPDDHPDGVWNGLGWFRLKINIDSSLLHYPLMYNFIQAGASEIYLDGKLINKSGKVGNSKENEIPFEDRNPLPITFNNQQTHLLAVKYSNHSAKYFNDKGFFGGFQFIIGYAKNIVNERLNAIQYNLYNLLIFATIPFVLALLHFVIFIFYPRFKENIYYSMYMLGFAGIVTANHLGVFTTNQFQVINTSKLGLISENIAIVFGLLTTYIAAYKKIPRHGWIFITFGLALVFWVSINSFKDTTVQDIFLSLVVLEMLRCIFFVREVNKISRLLLFGILFLLASVIYSLVVAYGFITPVYGFTNSFVFGVLVLSIIMSIQLSKNFADTYKQLEIQLVQVKELSAQALENERKAKEQEIERRLLEADNKRKTVELENARRLQLSMLPKEIPQSDDWAIDVFMRTATEVGGDYYDFHTDKKGSLTIAVGDATGHGVNAGTMVAVTKSLFNELAANEDIVETFNKYNSFIKSMNLGNLYMAMTIAKFYKGKMTISSAGMPPVLIYRALTKTVEEIILKGMPLGGFLNYPYQQVEINLNADDIVLFLSDGLPEMFNKTNDLFGWEKTKEEFRNILNDHQSASSYRGQDIIEKLLAKAETWANGRIQEDDITFVVLKNLFKSS